MNITISGKEYALNYNNKALFRIEKELDKPVLDVLSNEKELSKIHTIYAVIWGGIDGGITFDEFSDLVKLNDIEGLIPAVMGAINASFDTGEKKK